jgi:hypothetical protein
VEDMPTARYMELLDKAEKREITPAELEELRKISGERINEKTVKFRRENPGGRNVRFGRINRCPPGVSRSQHWLDGVKGFYGAYGVDENHPRVARVLASIQRAETAAILTDEEAEEFRKEIDLLQDDLIAIWNAAHPWILQRHREKPVSKFTETYWRYLISPGPDKLPVAHEPTEEGSECKPCGQKKIYWEQWPDCSLVKPPAPSPEAREAFRRRLEDELQQARKFVERAVSERQKELFAKGVRELEEHLDKLNNFES